MTNANERSIRYVADSYTTLEGPGIPIRRPLPSEGVKLDDVDPMLLLDHFDMDDPPSWEEGEGTHRHRGFEVISYIMQGRMDDRLGEGPVQHVEAGGLQRITTGAGVTHGGAASPRDVGPVKGLQFWINLSQKDKKLEPGYQLVESKDIPEKKTDAYLARILVGEGSPTQLRTPALLLDVTVRPQAEFGWEIPESYQGYVYVLEGEGEFGAEGKPAKKTQIAVLGKGKHLKIKAGAKGLRFFLAAGQPHHEPIRWRGPYVD
jgi:redox-sensitive bicupin YhaK (pirin superfamily)